MNNLSFKNNTLVFKLSSLDNIVLEYKFLTKETCFVFFFDFVTYFKSDEFFKNEFNITSVCFYTIVQTL